MDERQRENVNENIRESFQMHIINYFSSLLLYVVLFCARSSYAYIRVVRRYFVCSKFNVFSHANFQIIENLNMEWTNLPISLGLRLIHPPESLWNMILCLITYWHYTTTKLSILELIRWSQRCLRSAVIRVKITKSWTIQHVTSEQTS